MAERDRVFWSAGHKAPALYVALGRAGYFPLDDVVCLRQLGSGFEGHPNWLKVPGIEYFQRLPGQGLGAAVGSALGRKLPAPPTAFYVIMGRRRKTTGSSVWEGRPWPPRTTTSITSAAIIDVNRLQIDGWVKGCDEC